MKIKLLNLFVSFLTIGTFAQTFTTNDLNYNVLDAVAKTVEVTGSQLNTSGLLTIPATVTDATDSTEYTVTTIGSQAFRSKAWTSLSLPNTLTTIDFRGFRDNSFTSAITIPASVTTIDAEAFAFGTLTEVISESVTPPASNKGAFTNNAEITLTVPVGSENDYKAAAGWERFLVVNDELIIGKTFTKNSITYRATSSNPNTVTLTDANNATDNLTILETLAVGNITINVTAIGDNAIDGTLLTSITADAITAPTLGTTPFGDNSAVSLIIPGGTTDSYTSAGWTGFSSFTEAQTNIAPSAELTTNVTIFQGFEGDDDITKVVDGIITTAFDTHPREASGKNFTFKFISNSYTSGSFIFFNRVNNTATEGRINGSTVDFKLAGVSQEVLTLNTSNQNDTDGTIRVTPAANVEFDEVVLTFLTDTQNFREIEIYGTLENSVTLNTPANEFTNVKVYANNNKLYVNGLDANATLTVYNYAGSKITESALTNTNSSINLASGFYIVVLEKNNIKQSIKIIVN